MSTTDHSPIPRSYGGRTRVEPVSIETGIGPWGGQVKVDAAHLRGNVAGRQAVDRASFVVEAKWHAPGALVTNMCTCPNVELAKAVAARAAVVLAHPAEPDLIKIRNDIAGVRP